MGGIHLPEILLIAVVVLLLFGGKKIPELMQGLGKGVRSFKDGLNGIDEEKKDDDDATSKPSSLENDKKTEK